MDCVNIITDIILSKKTKVVRNIMGISEDDKWNHVYNEDTGNKNLYTY